MPTHFHVTIETCRLSGVVLVAAAMREAKSRQQKTSKQASKQIADTKQIPLSPSRSTRRPKSPDRQTASAAAQPIQNKKAKKKNVCSQPAKVSICLRSSRVAQTTHVRRNP